jgi:hypothetical protein
LKIFWFSGWTKQGLHRAAPSRHRVCRAVAYVMSMPSWLLIWCGEWDDESIRRRRLLWDRPVYVVVAVAVARWHRRAGRPAGACWPLALRPCTVHVRTCVHAWTSMDRAVMETTCMACMMAWPGVRSRARTKETTGSVCSALLDCMQCKYWPVRPCPAARFSRRPMHAGQGRVSGWVHRHIYIYFYNRVHRLWPCMAWLHMEICMQVRATWCNLSCMHACCNSETLFLCLCTFKATTC